MELHEERSHSSICAKSRSAIRSVQDVFDETVECYYNREYDNNPGGVLARRGSDERTRDRQRFRGLQSQEIMEEQAKSGGLYSGLIDLDNLMDKGVNKSSPQLKQTMASMQQKGGAQPHPPSSIAQQQPNYNVSLSMGWGQSMGMQNPGMGKQNHGMGMQNPGMGYGMM